jgi:hypothetical protein
MRQRLLGKFTAPAMAMFIYSSAPSIFGGWFEKSVAGLLWKQMLVICLLFNIPKYSLVWLYKPMTNKLEAVLAGNSRHPIRKALADGTALSALEVTLYTLCAWFVKLTSRQLALMVSYYLVKNLSFGWLYDRILNWVRNRFAVYSLES